MKSEITVKITFKVSFQNSRFQYETEENLKWKKFNTETDLESEH